MTCQSDIKEIHKGVKEEAGFFCFLSKFLIQKYTNNVRPLKRVLFVAEYESVT